MNFSDTEDQLSAPTSALSSPVVSPSPPPLTPSVSAIAPEPSRPLSVFEMLQNMQASISSLQRDVERIPGLEAEIRRLRAALGPFMPADDVVE